MNEEIFFIKLRDCFNAGYQMPQFCLDNNIKNPLFIAFDANQANFLWEIFVQFKFNKKLQPQFALINGQFNFPNLIPQGGSLKISNIADFNLNEFDKIIFLSSNKKVFFDTNKVICLDFLTQYFINSVYVDIPLIHFLQNNPKIKLITIPLPYLQPNPQNTEREKRLIAELGLNILFKVRPDIENSNGKKISTPYDFLGYTNEEVYDLLDSPNLKENIDGSTSYEIIDNPFITIRNGKRITLYQPDKFKNRIYFVGNCPYFGYGVPDDKTLESLLQKFLNDNGYSYRVENESQSICGRYQDIFYNLKNLSFLPGDIVFFCSDRIISNKLPFFNLNSYIARPHNYGEIFADEAHINELGHKALAEIFFKLLIQNNFFQDIEFNYPAPPPPPHRYGIPKENFYGNSNFINNKDLESYKEKLREKRLKIGAIVMNCNPFTNGHKALIEYAAARVQKLYIFVVEEDKSEFKFADRLRLVQMGVEEFPNVEVIPSGQFIISQKTFAGYFNKAELQNIAVDSSEDVEIFAREIAPTLGINIRFVGEEPEDTVTRQYNENMKNILPRYGIDFCEIPRKEINGEVISAKSVRAALKVGDFEKISKLVPITTLEFLRNNYAHSTPPPLPVGKN